MTMFFLEALGENPLHWLSVQFSSVQSLSHVQLFVIPWIAASQASLSITNSQSLLKLMSIELVMPSSRLIFTSFFFLWSPSSFLKTSNFVSFQPGKTEKTEKPGELQSMESQRVGHDWETQQQQQKQTFFPINIPSDPDLIWERWNYPEPYRSSRIRTSFQGL